MRKAVWITVAALSLVAVAWVQVNTENAPPPSTLMPAGPMIYLEAKDLRSVLNDWNRSTIKRTSASPRPLPGARASLPRCPSEKTRSRSGGGTPGPSSDTRIST